MSNLYTFQVEESARGDRLDVFLSARSEVALSRAQIQRLITAGRISLNDRPAKASQRLQGGDRIVLEAPPPVEETPAETPEVQA